MSPKQDRPRARQRRATGGSALAAAIERADWERAGLLVLIGVVRAARSVPDATVDDVLALLEEEAPGARDAR